MNGEVIQLLPTCRREAEAALEALTRLSKNVGQQTGVELIIKALEGSAMEIGGKCGEEVAVDGLSQLRDALDDFRSRCGVPPMSWSVEISALTGRVDSGRAAKIYREAGLPTKLVETLTCRRDLSFARGFNKRVRGSHLHAVTGGECFFTYEIGASTAELPERGKLKLKLRD